MDSEDGLKNIRSAVGCTMLASGSLWYASVKVSPISMGMVSSEGRWNVWPGYFGSLVLWRM